MRRPILSLLILLLVVSSVRGQNDHALAKRLQPLIDAHRGDVGVAVRHLPSGRSFAHRSHEPMPTASLIKLAVMVETYRQAGAGQVPLDRPLTLRAEDKVQGSGILTTHFSPGVSLTLRDAVRLMIAFSDNTATNLVVDQIGLPSTSKCMEQLGLPNTKLHARVFQPGSSIAPERSRRWGLGSTTAAEMVELLSRLHRRELVSSAASEAMLAHLFACEDKGRFPRFLPAGTKVAHKTGSVAAVRTDGGLIETPAGAVALCVLTTGNEDQRWTDDSAGTRLCADIARAAYDVFNAEPDPARDDQQPADSLDGPPFTTARAWTIADGKTGKILWEDHDDQPLEMASTTKIMTAYVILKLAEKDSSLLDETVTISPAADRTEGTSAEIRAGDRVTVSDLLCGLMLPSGNDAAVALAEGVGRRFDAEGRKDAPAERFVAEMNRAAKSLELSQTRFLNPHGLPEKGHVTTARDLARLAYTALQLPSFQKLVATRKMTLQLKGKSGEPRTVEWENKNELLEIAGYTGVKTGTTKAAGACLVASGQRGDDRLIVVVLGCPTNAARYVDTRNLFRWAWNARK